jgi:hypothetical protein
MLIHDELYTVSVDKETTERNSRNERSNVRSINTQYDDRLQRMSLGFNPLVETQDLKVYEPGM